MDIVFPDCAYEGAEWAFRATSMLNRQNARITELERQLAELREATRAFLEIVRAPTNAEEYKARAEVERVLEGMI